MDPGRGGNIADTLLEEGFTVIVYEFMPICVKMTNDTRVYLSVIKLLSSITLKQPFLGVSHFLEIITKAE
jgi:hypothetical protein